MANFLPQIFLSPLLIEAIHKKLSIFLYVVCLKVQNANFLVF